MLFQFAAGNMLLLMILTLAFGGNCRVLESHLFWKVLWAGIFFLEDLVNSDIFLLAFVRACMFVSYSLSSCYFWK